MFLTLAVFVTAGVAGRLTSIAPVRPIICAGFVLVTAGLLLMRGLTAGSGWTHLIPGMIVAGAGAGLVSVPLAWTPPNPLRHNTQPQQITRDPDDHR